MKNLKGVVDKSKHESLRAALLELGHSEKARAEELSPVEFQQLFHRLKDT
ncbi:MAG: hypothetical protein HC902_14795 [Calothrix sp. SM1_5_4]|nr:hypothetical protein [Calothrix sp. SM1_5_4]